jgi:L-lysine 2,3-aminomutase
VIDNLANYKAMHQLSLPNSVPLSMWQTPVLPGMKFNHQQEKINWELDNTISVPKNKNELAFYTIEQLASLIKNKKLSSLELTRFFIDRIKNMETLCNVSLACKKILPINRPRRQMKKFQKGNTKVYYMVYLMA